MAVYKIIYAERVDSMLLAHIRFLSRVSINAAKRFRREYAEIAQRISDNPYQFPASQDEDLPDIGYREAGFSNWYKAIFLVEGHTVYLDAVLDCRMDNKDTR